MPTTTIADITTAAEAAELVARNLTVPDCPPRYARLLVEEVADMVAQSAAAPDLFEAMADHAHDICDGLVPIYTTERFDLAAAWSDTWDTTAAGDGAELPADIVEALGIYIYEAFRSEVFSMLPDWSDLADLFGVDAETVELAQLLASEGRRVYPAVWEVVRDAALLRAGLPAEALPMAIELVGTGLPVRAAAAVAARAVSLAA